MKATEIFRRQRVKVGIRDSDRSPIEATIDVRFLSMGSRLQYTVSRIGFIFVVGLFITVLPLLHVCGAAIIFLVVPVVAFRAWRSTVLVGPGTLPCPKCTAPLTLAVARRGWPVHVPCMQCGSLVVVNSAE